LPRNGGESNKPETPESESTSAAEATEAVESSAPPEPDKATESKATQSKATEESAVPVADSTDADESEPDEGADEEIDEEIDEKAKESAAPKRNINWSRVAAYGLLPALALLLALASGYLKWQSTADGYTDISKPKSPAAEAMQVAKDSTVRMLSYSPDTVDQQLNSARDLLTGEFRDSYTGLINDVVIPGAKEKQISAVASVPAAAVVSADQNHAVLLVFVNQTVVVGGGAPTDTASSVRVAMEKHDDHWLISKFDPV
jgi:Mce-associated membrane protein